MFLILYLQSGLLPQNERERHWLLGALAYNSIIIHLTNKSLPLPCPAFYFFPPFSLKKFHFHQLNYIRQKPRNKPWHLSVSPPICEFVISLSNISSFPWNHSKSSYHSAFLLFYSMHAHACTHTGNGVSITFFIHSSIYGHRLFPYLFYCK